VVAILRARLEAVSRWLEGREYLEGRFTVGDLMMSTVLRIPRHTMLLAELPKLTDYQRRCEARPAFQKALAAHMATFAAATPPA
jgi:glutathione S-transferase